MDSPTDSASTHYPIVLLHGIGYRDDMPLLASWGRIPEALRAAGASVYQGGLDAWATHESNAALLKTQVEGILARTGAEKVNLIAHSKGGLEARYLISRLGMSGRVASLATVCTPHRGTTIADLAAGLVPDGAGAAFRAVDFLARWAGDRAPSSGEALRQLTRRFMEEFNRMVPDAPGVYYQSYGALMKHALDDPFFALPYEVLRRHEGANDGVVAAASCQWGEFKGFISGTTPGHGVSHLDMVDFRRREIAGVNIPGVYVGIAVELKRHGF